MTDLERESTDGIVQSLAAIKTSKKREEYLRHHYPATFVALLKSMQRNAQLQKLQEGVGGFTWVIIAEILPQLDKLHREGKLTKVESKKMKLDGVFGGSEVVYTGQVDAEGRPHGFGKCEYILGYEVVGTFWEGKLHGVKIETIPFRI